MVRKIEYVLGLETTSKGHSLGVNALAYNPELVLANTSGGTLFSGGSDGRVNAWSHDPSTATTAATCAVDLHTNWVNDLLCFNNSVFSASADTTVKLWVPKENRTVTVGHHTDYAKCLASYSRTGAEWVASGGLDGRILGWDTSFQTPSGVPSFEFKISGDEGSLYALSANLDSSPASGSRGIIASGSSDSVIRLWDPRSKEQVSQLLGHTDNVRAILMSGSWLLSASSDSTVRLWNLAAGRLYKTFSDHNASVWSLFSDDPEFNVFYSGDRLGNVLKTHREHGAIPVATESRGVNKIAVTDNGSIWTCTADRVLRRWANSDNWNNVVTSDEDLVKAHLEPTEEIKGGVSLIGHRLLNDKRRVIVGRSDGDVRLVDIIQGITMDHQLPKIDLTKDISDELDILAEKVNTMDVLENWCQVSIKAGQLCVTLDERSYCNTEVYVDDLTAETNLDLGEYDDERRLNLGKWTLHNLLSRFSKIELEKCRIHIAENERLKAKAAAEEPPAPKEDEKAAKAEKPKLMSKLFGFRKKDKDAADVAAPGQANGASNQQSQSKEGPPPETYNEVFKTVIEDQSLSTDSDEFPTLEFGDDTRILISESIPGAGASTDIYQSRLGDTTRDDQVKLLEDLLPGWVGQLLLQGKSTARVPQRVSFNIVPLDGEKGPAVNNDKTRLLAHPVLRARKIMGYVVSHISQNGFLPPEYANRPAEEIVELYCQDVKLDPRMALATIRTRIWRSGGDVLLQYKLLPQPEAVSSSGTEVASAEVPQAAEAPAISAAVSAGPS